MGTLFRDNLLASIEKKREKQEQKYKTGFRRKAKTLTNSACIRVTELVTTQVLATTSEGNERHGAERDGIQNVQKVTAQSNHDVSIDEMQLTILRVGMQLP